VLIKVLKNGIKSQRERFVIGLLGCSCRRLPLMKLPPGGQYLSRRRIVSLSGLHAGPCLNVKSSGPFLIKTLKVLLGVDFN